MINLHGNWSEHSNECKTCNKVRTWMIEERVEATVKPFYHQITPKTQTKYHPNSSHCIAMDACKCRRLTIFQKTYINIQKLKPRLLISLGKKSKKLYWGILTNTYRPIMFITYIIPSFIQFQMVKRIRPMKGLISNERGSKNGRILSINRCEKQ